MKAVFLKNVEIADGKHRMNIYEGEELSAEDDGDFFILRKKNGWGTKAPKSAEGEIYKIVEVEYEVQKETCCNRSYPV